MTTDVSSLARRLRGRFLVFDGPDGAGKSTQRELFANVLQGAGADVLSCRDPGGTEIGDQIRSVLLDHDLSLMDVTCETLLFMASRAQLVHEVVRPAIAAGKTVLCDRFITSTCAYQGAAGYDPQKVIELAHFAVGDCWPDVTIVFDIDTEEGFKRIGRKPHHAGKNRGKSSGQGTLFADAGPDAMEARSIDFHRAVGRLFREVGTYYPTPVVVVDASGDQDAVQSLVIEELDRVFA